MILRLPRNFPRTVSLIGAFFDLLTIFPMLFPSFGAMIYGMENFAPSPEYRYAMAVAASLMAGWTCLLFWCARDPYGRSPVLLLTAFPVITCLALSGGYAVASEAISFPRMLPTWVVQFVLAILFIMAYGRTRAEDNDAGTASN